MNIDDRLFAWGQGALAAALAWVLATSDARGSTTLAALASAASALLATAALWQLRHSFRVRPTPRADGRLEREGIYRYLRHPMYLAVQMLTLGMVLWRPGPAVLAVAGVQYAFYWAKARFEEARLRERYPGYADYQHRSWGLWP